MNNQRTLRASQQTSTPKGGLKERKEIWFLRAGFMQASAGRPLEIRQFLPRQTGTRSTYLPIHTAASVVPPEPAARGKSVLDCLRSGRKAEVLPMICYHPVECREQIRVLRLRPENRRLCDRYASKRKIMLAAYCAIHGSTESSTLTSC